MQLFKSQVGFKCPLILPVEELPDSPGVLGSTHPRDQQCVLDEALEGGMGRFICDRIFVVRPNFCCPHRRGRALCARGFGDLGFVLFPFALARICSAVSWGYSKTGHPARLAAPRRRRPRHRADRAMPMSVKLSCPCLASCIVCQAVFSVKPLCLSTYIVSVWRRLARTPSGPSMFPPTQSSGSKPQRPAFLFARQ